jgi:hypothetical protein
MKIQVQGSRFTVERSRATGKPGVSQGLLASKSKINHKDTKDTNFAGPPLSPSGLLAPGSSFEL